MRKRVQTMLSGFLILAAVLALMLFALGAAMEGRRDEDEEGYEGGGKRGYERGGGAAAGGQRAQQPTVTYGAPTGATTGGAPLRTAGAAP